MDCTLLTRLRGARLNMLTRTHLHRSETTFLKRSVRLPTRANIETTFDRLACRIERGIREATHNVMLAFATSSFCCSHRQNLFDGGEAMPSLFPTIVAKRHHAVLHGLRLQITA